MPQRRRGRRLGPDWTQLGIAVAALFVGGERLARPLWVAWRSASWGTPFREFLSLQREGGALLTTPREALGGSSLLLSVLLLLVGLALLWSAFRTRRSPW